MNTVARRVLFYFFILVFVIVGAYLLLTAQGLVFDANNFRFVKTGALFLKFNPTDASLTLNGVLEDASQGFVIPGVLITDLKPGAYHLVLAKNGYDSWTKDLAVKSGIVTAAARITLWPATFSFTEVAKDPISDFWLTQSGAVTSDAKRSLHFDGTTLRGTNVAVSDKDSNYLISSEGKNYFFTDLQNPASSTNISSLFASLSGRTAKSAAGPITRILFHPFSAGRLLLTTSNGLYLLDLRRTRIDLLSNFPHIVAATTSENEVFLVNDEGKLLVFNLLLQTTNEYALGAVNTTKLETNPGGNEIFLLKKNGDLSRYDRSSHTINLLAHGVQSFFLSPGEERLALLGTDGSLRMLALKDYHSDTDVLQGAEWSIELPDSLGTPREFFWLPSFPDYGLVLGTKGAALAELDNRTPQNISIISSAIKKVFPEGNTIYAMKRDGSFVQTTLGE